MEIVFEEAIPSENIELNKTTYARFMHSNEITMKKGKVKKNETVRFLVNLTRLFIEQHHSPNRKSKTPTPRDLNFPYSNYD
mmetsp:Transcript_31661/g.28052  ORF Transcript_31661/g.28052 Transcript_31661/m.28052 type:complete len:81 (-) Transcript_31661:405-647(-)